MKDLIKLVCCVCGKVFEAKKLPNISTEKAYCSDACWYNQPGSLYKAPQPN